MRSQTFFGKKAHGMVDNMLISLMMKLMRIVMIGRKRGRNQAEAADEKHDFMVCQDDFT